MIDLTSRAKLPKRRKPAPSIPANIALAIRQYETAYFAIYKRKPAIEYALGYVRIDAGAGVHLMRLKELTRMLKDKLRDM